MLNVMIRIVLLKFCLPNRSISSLSSGQEIIVLFPIRFRFHFAFLTFRSSELPKVFSSNIFTFSLITCDAVDKTKVISYIRRLECFTIIYPRILIVNTHTRQGYPMHYLGQVEPAHLSLSFHSGYHDLLCMPSLILRRRDFIKIFVKRPFIQISR